MTRRAALTVTALVLVALFVIITHPMLTPAPVGLWR